MLRGSLARTGIIAIFTPQNHCEGVMLDMLNIISLMSVGDVKNISLMLVGDVWRMGDVEYP